MRATGLTLLEVMVALLIFALTATSVMKAAGDHLSAVGQIEEITLATWVANNRLSAMQLEQTWPPKNNAKGKQFMSDREWHWQQQVLETNDADMRQVTILVSSDQAGKNVVTSVSTFVSKPNS